MKTIKRYILLLAGLICTLTSIAQYNPDKICHLENGQLIFSINLKWSEKEKKEVSKLFDLDSVLMAKVYKGETVILIDGETWKAKKVKPYLVELSKPIQSNEDQNIKANDLFTVVDKWMNFGGNAADASVVYGVNDFKIANTFLYHQNDAWFYLPNNKSARTIYISGTFNNWSTTQTPMKAGTYGWTVDLNIKPGKYVYKYIIDGEWITDPYNKLREGDGAGGYNSIVYCYNHHFELKGHQEARKVAVTGNFYKWDQRGLQMNKTSDGWSLPIFLRDGTYAYKFLVDKEWMTDPANKEVRKDADGNFNSFIEIGESFLFKLDGFTTANKVVLTGSFNGWNESELLMNKSTKGWQLPYVVAAGNYEYKFIVDGKWMTDPANPFSNGSGNTMNSFIALKANHIFELNKFTDARSVIVTGSFNGWRKESYRMIKEDGKWIFPLYLQPGKYTYKFIVDGEWILDPSNKLYEQNEYDTNNSVLWIEPF